MVLCIPLFSTLADGVSTFLLCQISFLPSGDRFNVTLSMVNVQGDNTVRVRGAVTATAVTVFVFVSSYVLFLTLSVLLLFVVMFP